MAGPSDGVLLALCIAAFALTTAAAMHVGYRWGASRTARRLTRELTADFRQQYARMRQRYERRLDREEWKRGTAQWPGGKRPAEMDDPVRRRRG